VTPHVGFLITIAGRVIADIHDVTPHVGSPITVAGTSDIDISAIDILPNWGSNKTTRIVWIRRIGQILKALNVKSKQVVKLAKSGVDKRLTDKGECCLGRFTRQQERDQREDHRRTQKDRKKQRTNVQDR